VKLSSLIGQKKNNRVSWWSLCFLWNQKPFTKWNDIINNSFILYRTLCVYKAAMAETEVPYVPYYSDLKLERVLCLTWFLKSVYAVEHDKQILTTWWDNNVRQTGPDLHAVSEWHKWLSLTIQAIGVCWFRTAGVMGGMSYSSGVWWWIMKGWGYQLWINVIRTRYGLGIAVWKVLYRYYNIPKVSTHEILLHWQNCKS